MNSNLANEKLHQDDASLFSVTHNMKTSANEPNDDLLKSSNVL